MSKSRGVSRAVDSVNDLLVCSICMDNYDDDTHQPKLLPCHHSFCTDCLNKLVATTTVAYIDCPTCRQRVNLTKDGVKGLQTNFYVNQMRELVGSVSQTKAKGCRKHSNLDLTEFCQTCEIAICKECCKSDHLQANGHVTLVLEEAIREQVALLEMETTEAHQTIIHNTGQAERLDVELCTMMAGKEKALNDIDVLCDELLALLESKRQSLKEEVSRIYRERRENVHQSLEALKKQANTLSGLIEQSNSVQENGTINDLLAYMAKMSAKNSELRQMNCVTDPGCNYITIDADHGKAHLSTAIQELGLVCISKALPTKFHFEQVKATSALLTNVTFTAESYAGEKLSNYPLGVELVDPVDDSIPCLVQAKSEGKYEITFRPEMSGMHVFRIKFANRLLPSVVHTVCVNSNDPVGVLGDLEELDYPRALAIDHQNNAFVVDTGNSRIQKFDKEGNFLYEFPFASGNEQFSSCGIAINHDNNMLYCPEVVMNEADLSHSHAILLYSCDGQRLKRFSFRETLRRALSVAVNSIGHMIIADYELNAIFIFDKLGRFLKKFGDTGSAPGQFNRPTFVCVGEEDSIIVSDGDNHRIQVFDKTGKFMYEFGGRGLAKGKFNMPFGVAADTHGNILVVDGSNKRIQIFKKGGQFVAYIESLADQMNAPRGIAVTSDGHVWVADRDNHCIKKYKYLHCTSL